MELEPDHLFNQLLAGFKLVKKQPAHVLCVMDSFYSWRQDLFVMTSGTTQHKLTWIWRINVCGLGSAVRLICTAVCRGYFWKISLYLFSICHLLLPSILIVWQRTEIIALSVFGGAWILGLLQGCWDCFKWKGELSTHPLIRCEEITFLLLNFFRLKSTN